MLKADFSWRRDLTEKLVSHQSCQTKDRVVGTCSLNLFGVKVHKSAASVMHNAVTVDNV